MLHMATAAVLFPNPAVLLLFITPFCLTRALAPRAGWATSLATTGALAVIINTLVPIGLHVGSLPITTGRLTVVHAVLAVLAYASFRKRAGRLLPATGSHDRLLLILTGVYALLILPLTALAGIDTYKWLDLAMSVQVERAIEWFVHPMSLLGFTGRSYPSAQPLVLGSIMTISGLGVEWSYYLMSLVSSVLGISAAYLLGRVCLDKRSTGLWVAFLYACSPVFTRYNHWATGRGLFLAIFPLFLLGITNLSAARVRATSRPALFALGNLTLVIVAALWLMLSHKTGLIAVPAILISLPLALLLPRRNARGLVPVLGLMAVAGAIILSRPWGAPFPVGSLLGFMRAGATRFGWLLPLAAVGVLAAPGWLEHPHLRRFLPASILVLPFFGLGDMYGALIALIFVALAAAHGLQWLTYAWPQYADWTRRITLIMVALGAVVIVAHRSLNATPRRVRDAAHFLNSYDPEGPLMLRAERWRPEIQGYLTGCPRFEAERVGPVSVRFIRPPSLRGTPTGVTRAWIAYSRHMFNVSGVHVSLYGTHPRTYYVTVDSLAPPPENTVQLYAEHGVKVYAPAGQEVPEKGEN